MWDFSSIRVEMDENLNQLPPSMLINKQINCLSDFKLFELCRAFLKFDFVKCFLVLKECS